MNDLPDWIVEKSVTYLKTLPDKAQEQLKQAYHELPKDSFIGMIHFGWGMACRNNLRKHVCLDDQLPSKNWDDYYIELLELALELE